MCNNILCLYLSSHLSNHMPYGNLEDSEFHFSEALINHSSKIPNDKSDKERCNITNALKYWARLFSFLFLHKFRSQQMYTFR